MPATISVCIITKNEEANIRTCLESVRGFANEIIVVDSFSTDNTVAICQEYTNKISIEAWKGCGVQKKQAVSLATSDWVLLLDADEEVSPKLQIEIKQILIESKYNAYDIPFQSYYCGKKIRFGDWFREKHLRLFKRNLGQIMPRFHGGVVINQKIGKLKAKIIHYSYPNLDAVLEKLQRYSSYGAEQKQRDGKSANFFTALGHGCFALIRSYILRLGFLDGAAGLMLAIYNAETSYYRYLKLSELHHKSAKNYPLQNA